MATPPREYMGVDVTVYCSTEAAARRPAKYKVAAEWVGGGFRELKTFGFADDECLPQVYESAARRASTTRLAEGEELGPVGVYLLDPERKDSSLVRCTEVEERLRSQSS